ncbi:MAG: hypothetical protein LZF60_220114 [Nitrospira sp.]|nr:MAG: hypothetical protein LZF60_220114 [Nitrospira sp.]
MCSISCHPATLPYTHLSQLQQTRTAPSLAAVPTAMKHGASTHQSGDRLRDRSIEKTQGLHKKCVAGTHIPMIVDWMIVLCLDWDLVACTASRAPRQKLSITRKAPGAGPTISPPLP